MHVRALPELPGARMARGEGPHRAAKLRTPPDAQRGAGRWGSEGACLPAGPSRNPRARSPGRPMMCQTAPSGVPAQLLDHLVRWRRVATPGAAVRGSSGRRGGYARRLSRRGTEMGAREAVGREVGTAPRLPTAAPRQVACMTGAASGPGARQRAVTKEHANLFSNKPPGRHRRFSGPTPAHWSWGSSGGQPTGRPTSCRPDADLHDGVRP